VPLRFMSYLGMLCSLLGFLYAAFVVVMRLVTTQPITGWASLMVIVLMLGGVQMTMLGVLGEYLWRTLEASRRRPLYSVEDALPLEEDGSSCQARNVHEMRKAEISAPIAKKTWHETVG